jgi:hypothetical protein
MREAHDGCGWASGVLARGANCALNAKHPTSRQQQKGARTGCEEKGTYRAASPSGVGATRAVEGLCRYLRYLRLVTGMFRHHPAFPTAGKHPGARARSRSSPPKGGNSQPSSCVVCEEAEEMDKQPPLIGAPPQGRPETTPNGSGRLLAVSTGNYTRRLTAHGAMNATSR